MGVKDVRVLLIEDNADDVLLIQEALATVPGTSFKVESAGQLASGLERLSVGDVDVVLLDLGLPDSQGLDTLARAQADAPNMPIIVQTGLNDEALALEAVRQGAQDYLVKGQVNGDLLARSIRYAIERHRLREELEQARQWEQLERERVERELHSLERLSSPPRTAVTAQAFGMGPLREAVPDTFDRLVQRYQELLDLALEQRTYRVDHALSEKLRSLAEEMGFLKGGPRDVVEVHSTALKGKTAAVPPQRGQAYVEEGRLMVLEAMGYLASYYRGYATGIEGASATRASASEDNRGAGRSRTS